MSNTLISQRWEHPNINYTIKDGLPSNEVYDVIQDRLGYMWFATDNGLSSFDGYEFKNYGYDLGLTDLVVFDLQEDKYNRIWMTSFSGKIFYLNKNRTQFIELKNAYEIIKMCTSRKKRFYFNDIADELLVECSDQKEMLRFKGDSLVGTFCYDVHTYEFYNNSFAITNDYIDYPKNLNIRIVEKGEEIVKTNILVKQEFNIHYGAQKIGNNYFIIYQNGYIEIDSTGKTYFKNTDRIEDVIHYQNGFLICYNNSGGLKWYKNNVDFRFGKCIEIIKNYSITGIVKNKFNQIWVTTKENGVYCFNNNFNLKQSECNFINTNEIIDITINSKNELLVGYKNSKVDFMNHENFVLTSSMHITNFGFNKIVEFDNNLYFIDKHRMIWSRNNFNKIKRIKSNKIDYLITYGLIKKSGSLFGFNQHSLFKINDTNIVMLNSFKEYNNKVDGAFDKQGNFLSVGYSGFIKHEFPSYLKTIKIKNNNLNNADKIIIDKKNRTILGSRSGGIKYIEENKILSFDEKNGLLSNNVTFLSIDSFNNLWVGSGSGLSILSDEKKLISNFSYIEGNKIGNVLKIINLDNYAIIASSNGLFRLKNKELFLPRFNKCSPIIEKIIMNDKEIVTQENYIFNHNENNIRIQIKTINLILKNKIRHRYRINNKEWVDLGYDRTINLFQINDGNYKIELESQNEYQVWSKPTTFTMIILPPWWETWWFYMVLGAAISFFTYLIMRNKLNSQKKDALLKEEIRNLEKSALQAQMNPHFIFNSLNSIQKFILLNDKEEASEYLSKFATLIRLNLKASNSTLVKLTDEVKLLKLYLEIEKLRFKYKFDYVFTVKINQEDLDKIMIPPMLIQPIIENSIIHGLSKSKENGLINVTLEKMDENLIVFVQDNGCGITQNNGLTKSDSYGSKITKRRLELLSSENQNSFTLKNLLNDQSEIIGSIAQLQIPL